MTVDPKQITLFAEKFRNYDPVQYEQFLRMLDAYTFDVTIAVTEAATDQLLNLQGRAQQARKFMQLFADAREPNKPSP